MPTDREERESRRIQSATRSRLLSRARRRASTPSASGSDAPPLSDLTEDMSMAGDDDDPDVEED